MSYLFVGARDFPLRTESLKVQMAGTCGPCHETRDTCAAVDQRLKIWASLDLPVHLQPAEREWVWVCDTDLRPRSRLSKPRASRCISAVPYQHLPLPHPCLASITRLHGLLVMFEPYPIFAPNTMYLTPRRRHAPRGAAHRMALP